MVFVWTWLTGDLLAFCFTPYRFTISETDVTSSTSADGCRREKGTYRVAKEQSVVLSHLGDCKFNLHLSVPTLADYLTLLQESLLKTFYFKTVRKERWLSSTHNEVL